MLFNQFGLNLSCEDNMQLMARYPDGYFDLAIVDPPYFSGPDKLGYYGANITSTGVNRKGYEKSEHWDLPNQEYFNELYRVSKNQIIWGCNYYEKFINTPGRIVWDKVNYTSSFSDAEIASCSLHDSIRMFSYMWNGMMQGKNALEGKVMQGNKSKNEKRIHPTQKPVMLYSWILSKYAKPGYKILDTHFGSGSIAIACYDYDIELTACDKDEKCFHKAIVRLKNHTSQSAIFRSFPVSKPLKENQFI